MKKITVWTKQHKDILKILEKEGRYISRKEYIENKFETISPFYLDIYTWYTDKASQISEKPGDVKYPVWVSLTKETTLGNDEDTIVLEISVEESRVMVIDIEKWGYIANYLYIPKDEKDDKAHQIMLASNGVDDPTAYMSSFYPAIKRKIIKSWERLFDGNSPVAALKIGTLWEVRKEWIINVIR